MDARTLRAWRAHRQGLDGSTSNASPAAVLSQSGWARSVGGVGPYLTLFARAGTSRSEADAAVAALEIHELPSARGCTYVVPAADFALALTLADAVSGREFRGAEEFGVTRKEMDRLERAVLDALQKGPASPEELREAAGGAVRSLGPDATKKGFGTTLPIALGELQTRGAIRRVPVNGRLDQQRYKYARWDPSPLAKSSLSFDEACTELARRYFTWVGPARLAEFQWFSGLSGKAAKAAAAPLTLAAVGVEGYLLHEADVEAYQSFVAPTRPIYRLVSSLDALTAHRREVRSLLDEGDYERAVFSSRGKMVAGRLSDLPSHAIVDRGRLVGMWEYDAEAERIVWVSFGVRDKALAAEVARTEQYVRADLGDARSFSLDSPRSRAPRLAWLARGA
jgi:hypothetical protein